MQTVLVLHGVIRWAVVVFGVWVLFSSLSGVMTARTYTKADNKANFFFMLVCDIQLLLGLILYFTNSWFDRLKDIKNLDANSRFFAMEHMALMIIAWILVHIGRASVTRTTTDRGKHKRVLIFFGIAILLILISIPWPFRETVARPLLRGFS